MRARLIGAVLAVAAGVVGVSAASASVVSGPVVSNQACCFPPPCRGQVPGPCPY